MPQRTLCLPATDQGGAPPPLAPALQSWEVEVERGDARGGHYGETLSLETSLGTVVGRRLLGGPWRDRGASTLALAPRADRSGGQPAFIDTFMATTSLAYINPPPNRFPPVVGRATPLAVTIRDLRLAPAKSGASAFASEEARSRATKAVIRACQSPNSATTAGGAVLRSTDGGGTWAGTPPTGDFRIGGIAVRGSLVLASSDAGSNDGVGGVYRSLDGGGSWSFAGAAAGMTNGLVRPVAIDPASPSILLAGTNGGLFRSVDGGSSWAPVTVPTGTQISDVLFDPANAGVVYVAASNAPGGVRPPPHQSDCP